MLKSQLRSFLIHIYIKRLQQQHFKALRDNVDGTEILFQLDFSENFSFTEQNAVQSAHWTKKQCTLFTVHLWVEKNQSQSLTYMSDCLNHDKVAVHKYVHSVLLFVTGTYDLVHKINFFSDGSSSQLKKNICCQILNTRKKNSSTKYIGTFLLHPTGREFWMVLVAL